MRERGCATYESSFINSFGRTEKKQENIEAEKNNRQAPTSSLIILIHWYVIFLDQMIKPL
jgi:hypothetical protein